MKKIKSIIIGVVVFITSGIIVVNAFSDDDVKVVKENKKINKEKNDKEEFVYVSSNDNIDELLKKEEVVKTDFYNEDIVVTEEEIVDDIKNGFVVENDNTYYYENDELVIGEKEIDGNYYYFNEEGVMQKNIMINNKYYDEEGKLYSGFKDIDNNTYYFTVAGYVVGIYELDNKKYIFDKDGHMIRNSFYEDYYLNENGEVVTGRVSIGDRIYVFDEEGKLLNGFKTIDNKEYFFDENNNKLKGIQLIDNIRYYFDFETGELVKKDIKSIIDISSWQGDIDFELLKESNLVDGVIVRLGYGTTLGDTPVLDSKFERNISELNRLNIPYGIYFFGYAQNEEAAKIEADYTFEMLKKYSVNLSYPIFYDAELNSFEGVKYTKSLYKKVINSYIDKLKEYGYDDVGVYGNVNSLTSGNLSSLQKRIPKWVAQYYTKCEYEGKYVGWQYTSDGVIPGINGLVDMNIFY